MRTILLKHSSHKIFLLLLMSDKHELGYIYFTFECQIKRHCREQIKNFYCVQG